MNIKINKERGIQHQYQLIEHDDLKIVINRATGLIWQQSGSPNGISFDKAIKICGRF